MNLRQTFGRLALPLATAALLTACAPSFEARVTRFSALPTPPAKSFYIESANPEYAGGLEFASYANLVRKEMQANGFSEIATPASADVTVQLDYHVGAPRQRIETRPGSINAGWGGGWGWGGPGWGGPGWGWNPYWGGAGWGGGGWGGAGWGGGWGGGWQNQQVYSVTEYTTIMAMKMVRNADKSSVFEGRAETVSRTNNLPVLMPSLVRAMFARFPGNNGQPVRVRFNPNDPAAVPNVSPAR